MQVSFKAKRDPEDTRLGYGLINCFIDFEVSYIDDSGISQLYDRSGRIAITDVENPNYLRSGLKNPYGDLSKKRYGLKGELIEKQEKSSLRKEY